MPKTLKNKHQFKKNKTHKIRGGGFFDFLKKDDLPFMYFYNFEITKADGKTVEEKEEDEKSTDENSTQIEVVTGEKTDEKPVKIIPIKTDENSTQIEVGTGEKPFDETPKNQVKKKVRINLALNKKYEYKKEKNE